MFEFDASQSLFSDITEEKDYEHFYSGANKNNKLPRACAYSEFQACQTLRLSRHVGVVTWWISLQTDSELDCARRRLEIRASCLGMGRLHRKSADLLAGCQFQRADFAERKDSRFFLVARPLGDISSVPAPAMACDGRRSESSWHPPKGRPFSSICEKALEPGLALSAAGHWNPDYVAPGAEQLCQRFALGGFGPPSTAAVVCSHSGSDSFSDRH